MVVTWENVLALEKDCEALRGQVCNLDSRSSEIKLWKGERKEGGGEGERWMNDNANITQIVDFGESG